MTTSVFRQVGLYFMFSSLDPTSYGYMYMYLRLLPNYTFLQAKIVPLLNDLN